MALSALLRRENIKRIETEEFDILIIGGGISGAGIARDAASRGMRVALIEARDFAEGTSSRSSKLIHGGIRYLENLEFGLVFEALNERRRLFELAPHLVHPLRFVLPVYKGARVGLFKLGLGMWVYDALSLFEMPEMHEYRNVARTLEHASILDAKDLAGSYAYSDAYMDDDRLVLETLRSADRFGAVLVNHVSAIGAGLTNGRVTSVQARDEQGGQEFTIRARHFVSTVGPWTDELGENLLGNWKKIMRPTKGVHLTFSRERLPLKEAVVMVSDDQKRIAFAIPRHEMVIIGTTDTDFKGDPADVHTDRADVDYLLHMADRYFPGAKLTENDILASYAGVRPLVHDGSSSESKTSREHVIIRDPRNVTFLTGGKYTTYRHMAEQTVSEVLNEFSVEEQVQWSRGRTLEPLNPLATADKIRRAVSGTEIWAQTFGVDVGTAHFLAERHGGEARVIMEKFGSRVVKDENARWVFEALHAIHETMCSNLKDFYLRRVPLFLSRADHGFALLPMLAEVFAKELGWSEAEKTAAINATRQHVNHEMSWVKN